MENNLRATKGNLVLLTCWDSNMPEDDTSPPMFDFFQAQISNRHKCYSHLPHRSA